MLEREVYDKIQHFEETLSYDMVVLLHILFAGVLTLNKWSPEQCFLEADRILRSSSELIENSVVLEFLLWSQISHWCSKIGNVDKALEFSYMARKILSLDIIDETRTLVNNAYVEIRPGNTPPCQMVWQMMLECECYCYMAVLKVRRQQNEANAERHRHVIRTFWALIRAHDCGTSSYGASCPVQALYEDAVGCYSSARNELSQLGQHQMHDRYRY